MHVRLSRTTQQLNAALMIAAIGCGDAIPMTHAGPTSAQPAVGAGNLPARPVAMIPIAPINNAGSVATPPPVAASAGSAAMAPPGPVVTNEVELAGLAKSKGGNPIPLLLFRGGYACRDVNIVTQPIDARAHMRTNPDDWDEWRRTAEGRLEWKVDTTWDALPYDIELLPLPARSRLSGTFQAGAGIDAGSAGVAYIVERYRFWTDGTYSYCKSTVISGSNTKRVREEGDYNVDGYTIETDDTVAASQKRAFFFDPQQPKELWVEHGYFVATADRDELCD